MSNILKFPYDASRRVYSRRPRRSKNGTPEERAAKTATTQGPAASIVPLAPREPAIDRRKLRGSPLRERVTTISFAATIVGKMHTADLKGEALPFDAAGWLEEVRIGATTARYVADEFDKAAARLQQNQEKFAACELDEAAVMTREEFGEAYSQAPLEIQQAISDKIRAVMAESEVSDVPLNLTASALGQSVLNIADGDL